MPDDRKVVYERVEKGLKIGGMFVMEMFTPRQLEFGTGGPSIVEMMVNEEIIRKELKGFDYKVLIERDRDIIEGNAHSGKCAVVQLLAIKL